MNEVAVYDDNVPAIADDSLLMIAQQAERRIDAVIKIKKSYIGDGLFLYSLEN